MPDHPFPLCYPQESPVCIVLVSASQGLLVRHLSGWSRTKALVSPHKDGDGFKTDSKGKGAAVANVVTKKAKTKDTRRWYCRGCKRNHENHFNGSGREPKCRKGLSGMNRWYARWRCALLHVDVAYLSYDYEDQFHQHIYSILLFLYGIYKVQRVIVHESKIDKRT